MRTNHFVPLVALLASLGCTRPSDGGAAANDTAGAATAASAAAPAAAPADPIYAVPVAGFPAIGDERALVTIVEFTDYQCPFCRKVEETVTKLRAAYGADLRVVVVETPLPFHARARPAALTALAADAQGKFEAVHARLFGGANALEDDAIAALARDAALDPVRLDADRHGVAERALAQAEELAKHLGVQGTPTFFVNGRRVVGNQPLDVFQRVVDERLAAARALVRAGVRPDRVYEATIRGGLEHVVDDAKAGGACAGGSCPHGDEPPAVADVVEAVPTRGAPARGSDAAPITIVAFSDFECPFSARADQTIRALERAHPGQVRVVSKQRPLPMHEHARLAAKAALAADAQGKYWEYHDALYAHQDALDRASLERYAADVGLDAARFARDLDDPRLDARVDADLADADALHVAGTPVFFVNGRRVIGAQPLATFETAIAKR